MTTKRLETLTIGGLPQHFLVRGAVGAPVVLLVQAGPGFPLLHEANAIERALDLERRFRVVYWDQRGTGRSVDPTTAPLTVERLVTDVVELVAALTERLEVPEVAVIGFSLGGTLAALAAARSRRIARLVAVGPDVDFEASERFAWAFAREQAIRRGHRRALAELDAIGPPPHTTPEQFMTRVRWVTEFGGIYVGRGFGRLAGALAWRLFTSGFYSLAQAVRALRELPRTQARALAGLAGLRMPSRVDVPLTVLQGRLDVAAPPSVMLPWFESLEAPRGKSLVWLEHCAHTPHFEAPPAFRAALGAALAREASRSGPAR